MTPKNTKERTRRIKAKYLTYNENGEIIDKQYLDVIICMGENPPVIEITVSEEYGGRILKSILISPKKLKKILN